jgi:hypothetical protein
MPTGWPIWFAPTATGCAPCGRSTRHARAAGARPSAQRPSAARIAATNQLQALLDQHWPGGAAIFGRLDWEIALSFLERYPIPESTARLGEARLTSFLRRHASSGRRSAGELLARLRTAPRPVHSLDPGIVAKLVRAQALLLCTLLQTLARLERAIAAALDQHPKAQLLRPLPRIGTISLGQVVAEIGPLLDPGRQRGRSGRPCGAVPVTKRGGQQRAVCFRHATNETARNALTLYADNSRHASPWAERIYGDARARGCRRPPPCASWLAPGRSDLVLVEMKPRRDDLPGRLRPTGRPAVRAPARAALDLSVRRRRASRRTRGALGAAARVGHRGRGSN